MGYRDGVHAPVRIERAGAATVTAGAIPEGLRGTFARQTPDDAFEADGRHHWFDGDSMVHALTFGEAGVGAACRRIRTAAHAAEAEAGRALWRGILEPPAPDLPRGLPPLKDTANTHLVAYRDRLLATWWLSGTPLEVDPRGLDTLGPPPFAAALGARTVAAHPKVDPVTGELVFFGYRLHKPPYVWVGLADRAGDLVAVADLDTAGPRIPHDVAFTRRFVVFMDLPLGWDPVALRAGKRRIGFDREAPARIGLWRRPTPENPAGGDVRWFDVPPCYVYHLTSAYDVVEDGVDRVVITGCRVDDPIPAVPDTSGLVPRLDTIHLVPATTRWTLDLRAGAATVDTIDDTPTEFPRVDDRTWGRKARFAYHPRIARADTLQFDGFLKLDHDGGPTVTCAYPAGWRGGEVVFAPRPGGTAEDDGWILTALSHPDEAGSNVWVLDARAVDAGPVATVRVPWRMPLGFHAEWLAWG